MGTRTVTFTITDENSNDASATRDIMLSEPPTVTIAAGNLTFVEGDDPLAVDDQLTVVDNDSTELTGAVITITAGYQQSADALAAVGQDGITVGSFDAVSGSLTLSGTASLAAYQAVLRSLTYENASDSPTSDVREITVVVTDDGGNSASASRSIEVTPVNDSPVLELSVTTSSAEEGQVTTLDDLLAITDVDSANLSGATVTIDGFVAGEDLLTFTAIPNVTGTFDDTTGVLTFTGIASLEDYELLLQSVSYQNDADVPDTTDRTIVFEITDEGGLSGSASLTLSVVEVDDPVQVIIPEQFGNPASPFSYIIDGSTPIEFTVTLTDTDDPLDDYVLILDVEDSGIPAEAPQPMINPTTGEFSWTPTTAGEFVLRVIAVNSAGEANSELIHINVVGST